MSKKFKHLDLSPHWQQYFSKYPDGYTIIENLIDWVSQVDDMVDNQNELNDTVNTFGDRLDEFIGQYDTHLQETLEQTLSEWQNSGFLDIVINEALDTKYHEMDDRLTEQLTQTNTRLNQMKLNVLDYGAKGDGSTDDTEPIQNALDDLLEQGGGTLYFPAGTYLVTEPLLMKSNASTGGYDFPPYKMEGQSNNGTVILKENETKYNDIDAAVIMIHASLDFNRSVTSHQFENITIFNNSDGETTYGVYSNRSSRIVVNYSSFRTKKQLATLATHDRYAFYMGTTWSSSFKDSTFNGDYGFYIVSDSTSLLLQNLYSSSHKIGYRLTGTYSTINNCFGDFGRGTLFEFFHASYTVSTIAGEANDASTMMRFTNSDVKIDLAYFHKSYLDDGAVISTNGSNVEINDLVVYVNDNIPRGYLIRSGSNNKVNINKLRLTGAGGKFKYSDFDKMSSDLNEYNVLPDITTRGMRGIKGLRDTKGAHWDWYMEEPTTKTNDIYFGLKNPRTLDDGTDAQWMSAGFENGVYINSDFKDQKVLGWVRHSHTSPALRDGSNYYIPLILQGTTENRPTTPIAGMEYFDTTLGKPIWYYNGGWVDATGDSV